MNSLAWLTAAYGSCDRAHLTRGFVALADTLLARAVDRGENWPGTRETHFGRA